MTMNKLLLKGQVEQVCFSPDLASMKHGHNIFEFFLIFHQLNQVILEMISTPGS